MSAFRMWQNAAARLSWLGFAVLLIRPCGARVAEEETFPLLQIGSRMYTNVTVTTKAKDYIFILHAGGMANHKLAELPADLREKLGYASAEKRKASTNGAAAWAKAEVAKLETPQIKEVRHRLQRGLHGSESAGPPLTALIPWRLLLLIVGIMVLIHLFYSYCCMLICRKAGYEPGVLIWLPVLQFYPLFRAAGMSGWWFLAQLVPVVNLLAFILWSVNIVKARGKSGLVTLFLILPITNFFAFLYLAFSSGADKEEDEGEPQVMSLQTA